MEKETLLTGKISISGSILGKSQFEKDFEKYKGYFLNPDFVAMCEAYNNTITIDKNNLIVWLYKENGKVHKLKTGRTYKVIKGKLKIVPLKKVKK